ncbi:bifunctional hydroxymethylpyrimidine kinase/phosphomethylpyrimidine kinase [bacterium]|nr:bifunctional hydroxymethylpyrimidine kinase/phosphomethylpyrimidine kinase [bacterium]MBU1985133.1 bifunctional hydroxymethylpyrimidine kinase/phosphomethylpyrimidine kinase [bacterium]
MMNPVSVTRAEELLRSACKKQVAVMGDFMLDRHLKGRVRRISPEAPVPVVEIESETTGLGGAGNVVNNLASLGVRPLAFGVVGDDAAGQVLIGHLETIRAATDGVIVCSSRKTTEKTRIIAHDQHVVRADRETPDAILRADEDRILSALESAISSVQALILQDYNKGVLTEHCITSALRIARKHNVPTYVDPKFERFFDYQRTHLFKPNIPELSAALGISIRTDEELHGAARQLYERIHPELILVTRGEKGMALFLGPDDVRHVPTRAQKVHDVSGAGDTVLATYVAAEIGSATPQEAAVIANEAAGIVCGEVGVVPIDRERLLDVIGGRE